MRHNEAPTAFAAGVKDTLQRWDLVTEIWGMGRLLTGSTKWLISLFHADNAHPKVKSCFLKLIIIEHLIDQNPLLRTTGK